MAIRSKGVQASLDKMNNLLTNKNVFMYDTDSEEYVMHTSNLEKISIWKQAICESIEIMLHSANCYKGYRELFPDDNMRKFDRQYF